ncbi:hypothetical protein SLA2020_203640 [Shorea laevis]
MAVDDQAWGHKTCPAKGNTCIVIIFTCMTTSDPYFLSNSFLQTRTPTHTYKDIQIPDKNVGDLDELYSLNSSDSWQTTTPASLGNQCIQ